jgi:hypothetical protein
MRVHIASLAIILALGFRWGSAGPPGGTALPYDATCPVIYDNDGAIESGFTDIYVMALASARLVSLRGIITTCSYGEEGRKPPLSAVPASEVVRERQELIEKARRSGMRHLPDATPGPSLSLKRPASGRIEDTVPHDTPGARLVIQQARKAPPGKPLVIVMGGQATCVVDAYLLDPAIADRMVLAWTVGDARSDGSLDSREYNAGVDPWATYIAFGRLRVVAFPCMRDGDSSPRPFALTPKSRLGELPDTELRQTMSESAWPRGAGTFSEPDTDADAMGALPLTRSDYVLQTKRFSFSHWEPASWTSQAPRSAPVEIPCFREASDGKALAVWEASQAVATDEWWRRVRSPAAWGRSVGQVPYGGSPWPVPGVIEAEDFDHGGTGRAYHDSTSNFTREGWLNPIRCLEQVDLLAASGASGGYAVTRTAAGEWIAYTVQVRHAGTYALEVRVASAGQGGRFHLEFDGVDKTGSVQVVDTGGQDRWQVLTGPAVALRRGRQVMRLVMERDGPAGSVGDFDSIRLARARS